MTEAEIKFNDGAFSVVDSWIKDARNSKFFENKEPMAVVFSNASAQPTGKRGGIGSHEMVVKARAASRKDGELRDKLLKRKKHVAEEGDTNNNTSDSDDSEESRTTAKSTRHTGSLGKKESASSKLLQSLRKAEEARRTRNLTKKQRKQQQKAAKRRRT